jgi:sterol 3beta-glucosyltransferase
MVLFWFKGRNILQITILALGSRGDVQPVIPLGQGLQHVGHRVRIATFQAFEGMVRKAGLQFQKIHGDAELLLSAAGGNQGVEKVSNPVQVFRSIKRSYGKLASSLPDDLSGLYDSELILNQLPGNLFGPDLAQFLGVPLAILSVIPLEPTRTRPLFGFPPLPVPGYARLTYWLGNQMAWQLFRKAVNSWRINSLGLPARPFFGGKSKSDPVINGFSKRVVERPTDWGQHVYTTGWWFPSDPDWIPPLELQRFLDRGPAPIFIGFGSMPIRDPKKVTAAVVNAAKSTNQRVILSTGWGGLGGNLPDQIFQLDYAPYGWLFPRMKGVIHHGGSGTTGFALHSGVPSFVMPFLFDQFYWGDRTAALGAGPAPLPFRSMNSDKLSKKIMDLVENNSYRSGAEALASDLRKENGVEQAVQIIQSLFC